LGNVNTKKKRLKKVMEYFNDRPIKLHKREVANAMGPSRSSKEKKGRAESKKPKSSEMLS